MGEDDAPGTRPACVLAGLGGIVTVWESEPRDPPPTIVEENRSPSGGTARYALPWIAGLSLAAGGVLIGLGMGHFKHPRTTLQPGDQVVNPEGYHKMKHV